MNGCFNNFNGMIYRCEGPKTSAQQVEIQKRSLETVKALNEVAAEARGR